MSDWFGMVCLFIAGVALSKLCTSAFYYLSMRRKIKQIKFMAKMLELGIHLPSQFSFRIENSEGVEEEFSGKAGTPTFQEDCKALRLKLLELVEKMEKSL